MNGVKCSNMVIQRKLYAPGLERFMTAKKGWGVRARQSIAKNSFILEYTGEICSAGELERRMLARYKGDNHHYCLAMDNKIMIDLALRLTISVGRASISVTANIRSAVCLRCFTARTHPKS